MPEGDMYPLTNGYFIRRFALVFAISEDKTEENVRNLKFTEKAEQLLLAGREIPDLIDHVETMPSKGAVLLSSWAWSAGIYKERIKFAICFYVGYGEENYKWHTTTFLELKLSSWKASALFNNQMGFFQLLIFVI